MAIQKQTVLQFPVVSFRHLETPHLKQGLKDYYAIVDIKQLPDLSQWRKINVRDPKLRGSVPNAIREGLAEHPDLFLFMNRGLVIAAQDVIFDNKSNLLQLTLSDESLHGLLDGGHSYNIIYDAAKSLEDTRYVKIEFLTGFDREAITNVVDARNTSNQVKDESLMNLDGKFDVLKNQLSSKQYAKYIAYKEYELGNDNLPLPIDIKHVISILYCFDKTTFGDNNHPINAYSSKGAVLKHFGESDSAYNKLYSIASDLLRLYDHIHQVLPEKYSSARKTSGDVSHGKFGKLTGVTKLSKPQKLYFTDTLSDYNIPKGFIYAILASFRALLINVDGRWAWPKGVDPFEIFNGDVGTELASTLSEYALQDQNPNKTGKNSTYWASCYKIVETYYLRQRIAMLEAGNE